MKKKVLAIITATAMMLALLPSVAMAGKSSDEVTVKFSAGVPGAFDMVDESIKATGNLAEKFFPDIAGNEPAEGVSFADVLVAAHIEKYGVGKVWDYLDLGQASWDPTVTSVNRQFGHDIVGFYYVNGTASSAHVSACVVSKNDELFAGAYTDNTYSDLFSAFSVKSAKAIAGKNFSMKISSDNLGSAVVPQTAKLATVDKETGIMTDIDTSYASGNLKGKINKAGDFYLSATGKVHYKGYYGDQDGAIAGALAKITVGLDKTKITQVKAKGKKAVLKWNKVTGAKNYEIYKSNKKNGKFKKIATVKKISYTDKKVKKGKKYFYKVRAIAKVDGKTYKGAFSKTVKVKIKK
jgi:hypothetical protein